MSSTPPPKKLDTQELLMLLMSLLPVGQGIAAAVVTFNAVPKPRPAVALAPLVGVLPGSTVYKALLEVNDPVHNPSDAIDILGLDPNGNTGLLLKWADRLLAEAND